MRIHSSAVPFTACLGRCIGLRSCNQVSPGEGGPGLNNTQNAKCPPDPFGETGHRRCVCVCVCGNTENPHERLTWRPSVCCGLQLSPRNTTKQFGWRVPAVPDCSCRVNRGPFYPWQAFRWLCPPRVYQSGGKIWTSQRHEANPGASFLNKLPMDLGALASSCEWYFCEGSGPFASFHWQVQELRMVAKNTTRKSRFKKLVPGCGAERPIVSAQPKIIQTAPSGLVWIWCFGWGLHRPSAQL